MKKILFTLLLAIAAGLMIAGCSDKSTNNNISEGSYTDENYLLAKEDADSSMAEMTVDNEEVGDWVDWNPGLALVDSVSYDSTSGWHVRARTFENDYMTHAVVDSFRMTDLDSQYQFRRDSTTNIFERRLKKSFEKTARPESLGYYWTKTRERNTHWEGLADSVTNLNGDFNRHWAGENAFRAFDRVVEGTATDIQFYTADIRDGRPTYPFDGTFNGSMTLDVVTAQRTKHIEATLVVTYFPDHYHARLESGDNFWEWDHYYNP